MPKSGSENAARCAAFAGMKGCALSFYYRGARAFGVDVPGSRGDEQRAGRLAIKGEYLWVLGPREIVVASKNQRCDVAICFDKSWSLELCNYQSVITDVFGIIQCHRRPIIIQRPPSPRMFSR